MWLDLTYRLEIACSNRTDFGELQVWVTEHWLLLLACHTLLALFMAASLQHIVKPC